MTRRKIIRECLGSGLDHKPDKLCVLVRCNCVKISSLRMFRLASLYWCIKLTTACLTPARKIHWVENFQSSLIIQRNKERLSVIDSLHVDQNYEQRIWISLTWIFGSAKFPLNSTKKSLDLFFLMVKSLWIVRNYLLISPWDSSHYFTAQKFNLSTNYVTPWSFQKLIYSKSQQKLDEVNYIVTFNSNYLLWHNFYLMILLWKNYFRALSLCFFATQKQKLHWSAEINLVDLPRREAKLFLSFIFGKKI